MNQKSSIRSDDVLRLKIVIVLVYGLLTIVMIYMLGESGIPLVSQLILQSGAILNGQPIQVEP